ncbi:OmpA family protein [Croceitalea sp. MTPC5]|uniref:OmpA family protein n=1 Tax=Croceitalea sp. MTPC5 TaxID=3056565 RepID=UPI002B3C4E86|nr:OmpA family protein [Croceitalea sp. MTPC5]
MKTILFFLLTSILIAPGFAQESKSRAEKDFEDFSYIDAAKEYERKVVKGDDSQETLQRLGDAYYNNVDMANASKWYGQLFSKYERTLSPEYIFKYIHSLKGIGNYPLAKALMKIYAEKFEMTQFEVDQFNDNDLALDKIQNLQPQFVVTHLSLNSPFADFGPMFYQDKIIFASSRDSLNLRTRVYQWNEQPYLNLYEADTLHLGSDLVDIRLFGPTINTKYHEAITTFNEAGDLMYFTRNNYTNKNLERDPEGINHLKLYKSQRSEMDWSPAEEVPFNSVDYSVGQPALDPNGKRLFFVSDMPGGFGQTDIYFVELTDDGGYSEPTNLGPTINTSGREMFPFVDDEKLYFASDGHLGLGGLDVFESALGNGFSKPMNLGKPLNSKKDDFAFIIDRGRNRGYFSSNRDGGTGDDDIYSFERLPINCYQTIGGSIRNERNGFPEANAQVFLLDTNGNELAKTKSSRDGIYDFDIRLDCGTTYQIKVEKNGYTGGSEDFQTSLEPYSFNEVPLQIKKLPELIVNEGGQLKIKIEIIHFDFDKWDIRYDAAVELNKIVFLMNQFPKMIIKIESHTDSRGNDLYNEQLSEKRAQSTKDYIISQGIALDRIESAIGYGEKQLINRCENGVQCSNDEHDRNRRSEFIIVKME